MAIKHSHVPRARDEKLVVHELSDEVLVYDLERHRAHSLNRTAALVWRHCDGRTTMNDMVSLLQRELNMPADEEMVWFALRRLERARLLQERVTRPDDGTSPTRRELMRRLGLVGGLALLVPVVDSITAPAAAATGTLGLCACCSSQSQCGTGFNCESSAAPTGQCPTTCPDKCCRPIGDPNAPAC